jgi:hypothetical protein
MKREPTPTRTTLDEVQALARLISDLEEQAYEERPPEAVPESQEPEPRDWSALRKFVALFASKH